MTFKQTTLLTAVIASGLVLTAALMFVSFQHLVDAQQESFDDQSDHLANNMAAELEDIRDEIKGMTTIFYALDRIDGDSLRSHSRPIFTQHQAVRKTVFAQIVSDQQRATFEATKQEEGFISFAIHDYTIQAARMVQRASYLPITHVEPFDVDNVAMLGMDLTSTGDFKAIITQAITSGDDVALIGALGDEPNGLWLFKAIYAGFAGQSGPYFAAHSEQMVNGMLAIKVDITRLLEWGAFSTDSLSIQITVQDKNSGEKPVSIFQSDWQSHHSIWSGMIFSNQHTFALEQQNIVLYTSHTLPWLDRVFLLFFLSGVIGLGFTGLLVYSTRSLQQSERRNSAIFGSAMDAIISIDELGLIQEFNPAAERIFGHRYADVIGKNISDIIIPEDQRERVKTGMAHYFKTGEQHILNKQLELNALRNNGEIFPVEMNVVEVLAGKHRLFTAFLRDISERKKAQHEIDRLATVVEQSINAIIITNTQGVIQYVNSAFEKISGYSANEALGRTANIVKSGQHSEQYYADMWQALSSGKNWTGSFINKAKDGALYHVEQTIFPLHLGAECVGYASVQQDVTERDRLQEQAEHTDRLESLGVLAGGIAHDFNNLLTAIMGNTGLAKQKLSDQDSVLKYLNNIQNASESAASLCQQMLAYSGKGHFIIQPLNVSTTINEIVQLLKSSIAKRVILDIQLDQHLPAINADVGQIKQVIMNLVINASEAIGEHIGQIQITTAHVTLTDDDIQSLLGADHMQSGDFITLQISDNGCGMDEATCKKIFDPFFTTKFTGRGLGMSAILGIIRGHAGGLTVHSIPGEGTQFHVYFPVSEHILTEPPSTTPKSDEHVFIQGTVLVVDDEEMLRDISMSILEEIGLNVILAGDGKEALALLQKQQQHIDIVLLDMTMPKMGGKECYTHLRSMMPELEVIICSGYAEQEVKANFNRNNYLDFIQKPYLPKVLIEKVSQKLLQIAAKR